MNEGYTAVVSNGILAGMVLSLDANGTTGSPEVHRAIRGTDAAGSIVGISSDDATNVGNTIVYVDPVDQTYYVHPAQRIGDYMDETLGGRTENWTATSSSRRGVTCFANGGWFATDQYVAAATASGAGPNADSGAAPGFALNDGYSFGSTATNAGKLIGLGGQSIQIVAYQDDVVLNGLLSFRLEL
jgi:hypothetical protein